MKGVILAGGTGSRLFPLTRVTNKHLLPVGKYPMIVHPIMKLRQAEITNILIITGREHMGDMIDLLGSGASFGVEFTYRVQDEAGGIAQALGLAEHFVGDDSVCVVLGDNIFSDSLTPFIEKYESEYNGKGAMVLLKEVPDPQRFGVAEMQGSLITSIIEKPKDPENNMAVIGVYIYDNTVFEIVKTLKPSGRGELEITDVNNAYLNDEKLTYGILQGWWTDAGTYESYPKANELAMSINWNLPDLVPAPTPTSPKRPGFIDPYMRVAWPPPLRGYYPVADGARPADAAAPPPPAKDVPLTEEEKKIQRRKREREAGTASMPKFKEMPKDPFPHDFDEETSAPTTASKTPEEAEDMADLIFAAEETDHAEQPTITRPELYHKTCEDLPDCDNTIFTTDGTRSNNWVPAKYYEYIHFPERVYNINYDKFEHKLALATQIDRMISSIEGITRRYPENDDRQIRICYYFTHKNKEYVLACISLGDSMPPQPHVMVWIKLDLYQEIENVGLSVEKFRFDGEDARLITIDSIDQLQGLADILVDKIKLRLGVKLDRDGGKSDDEDEEIGSGRSF
ncbi:NTP transferase domain-containing protein [bacterium]|nr:NTP transferase domain-containing protein [bacterium]